MIKTIGNGPQRERTKDKFLPKEEGGWANGFVFAAVYGRLPIAASVASFGDQHGISEMIIE